MSEFLKHTLYFSYLEHRIRDQGTFLGSLWTLLNPLFMFLVLYFLFKPAFSGEQGHFDSYLLTGIIIWNFFSISTQSSASIISRRPQFIRSSNFTPVLYIFGSLIAFLYCSLFESLIASFVLWIIGQNGFELFGGLLIGLLLTVPLSFGTALILSVVSTFFLDATYLWSLALRLGFFLTPIFYHMSLITDQMRQYIFMNPLLYPLLLSRSLAQAESGVHGTQALLISLTTGAILTIIGLVLVNRYRYRLVEVL